MKQKFVSGFLRFEIQYFGHVVRRRIRWEAVLRKSANEMVGKQIFQRKTSSGIIKSRTRPVKIENQNKYNWNIEFLSHELRELEETNT